MPRPCGRRTCRGIKPLLHGRGFPIRADSKTPATMQSRAQKCDELRKCFRRSGLLDETGLDRLDGHPHALRAAVRGFDPDALQVGPEFALRDAGHVRANAAALLRLTLAIDDRALDGTATGDCTDSGHDGFELVKGSEVKVVTGVTQGEFWPALARPSC